MLCDICNAVESLSMLLASLGFLGTSQLIFHEDQFGFTSGAEILAADFAIRVTIRPVQISTCALLSPMHTYILQK